ncbi:MAG: (Fe-S)-binding protein [bacterium]
MSEYPNYWYAIEEPPSGTTLEDFRKALMKVLEETNYAVFLSVYSDICANCLRCAERCPVYEVSGELRDIPAYRNHIIYEIYKGLLGSKQTSLGRLLRPGNSAAKNVTVEELAEMAYRCTNCKRCVQECPMGVNSMAINRLARLVLAEMGIVPKNLAYSSRLEFEEGGNTSNIPLLALLDTIEFLEEDIEDTFGKKVTFPRDVEGADYLFVAPVSDYMMEAETLMGIAMTLDAMGVSWTLGTKFYDAINYGLFYSDKVLLGILKRLVDEARRLKVPNILIGECGHATRTIKDYFDCHPDTREINVFSIHELTADAVREGKLKLNPGANPENVTLHDPCNIVRMGTQVENIRTILSACVSGKFIEMTPHGTENYCCGGGGGTVTVEETHEFRMTIGGLRKVQQIKAAREAGAEMLVAPCANCKKQLRELIEYHKIDIQFVGLHDLMAKALA